MGEGVAATPAGAVGAFQIGRVRQHRNRDRWHGDVSDVRVHDRVVVPNEVSELAWRKPNLLATGLCRAADGASPEQSDGRPLKLDGGASIYRDADASCSPDLDQDCPYVPPPLVGDRHLTLDGESGYATTGEPVVDTGDSFTADVTVRLSDSDPAHPMNVLSQAGHFTDAFKLRYDRPPTAGSR
jgi:hypothetical protein